MIAGYLVQAKGGLSPMYAAFAPLVGAIITLMNALNSRFAILVGSLLSTLALHVVGLAAVSLVLLVKKEERRPGRLPILAYSGGLVGVGVVFACNYAFSVLGASLAVALALLGQTLCSVAVDATGFLGKRKYRLSLRQLPGIALAIAGVAIMAERWEGHAPAMFVALISGALPVISISLNSELGGKIGVFRSARINFLVGLAATLVLIAAFRPPLAGAVGALASAGPVLVLGGGIMGLLVVGATNLIFPRLSAFSAVILIFSGQALAGAALDAFSGLGVSPRRITGILVVLAGLAAKAWADKARGDTH